MTGQPPNIQIAAQRSDVSQVRRRDSLIVEWRRAELALYAAADGQEAAPLTKAKKAALNKLRQVADSLIKAGHP